MTLKEIENMLTQGSLYTEFTEVSVKLSVKSIRPKILICLGPEVNKQK